jgi:hypothetical protein
MSSFEDNFNYHDYQVFAMDRHRALAAAHGVDRLMLLVPADAADPARVTAHEQALADLLAAGDPAGLGPGASSS